MAKRQVKQTKRLNRRVKAFEDGGLNGKQGYKRPGSNKK